MSEGLKRVPQRAAARAAALSAALSAAGEPALRSGQRAAAWSEAAFKEVYTKYIKGLYAYVRRRVRSHEDAEDVTAQVFAQAYDHLEPKDASSPEVAKWLFTVARNATLNHWRKKKFIATISIEELTEESDGYDPVKEAVKTDDIERLISIIQSLPEEQRKALILRFVDELSHAEIAELLGRSEGSARVLLHRTVSDIRRRIS